MVPVAHKCPGISFGMGGGLTMPVFLGAWQPGISANPAIQGHATIPMVVGTSPLPQLYPQYRRMFGAAREVILPPLFRHRQPIYNFSNRGRAGGPRTGEGSGKPPSGITGDDSSPPAGDIPPKKGSSTRFNYRKYLDTLAREAWRDITCVTDKAFFSTKLAEALAGLEPRLEYALKAAVGTRGEIAIPLGKHELVFYSSDLQRYWKGKEVLLTAVQHKGRWIFVCSVDGGKTVFTARYFDPLAKKLYSLGRTSIAGARTYYDRLDEDLRVRFRDTVIAFDRNWLAGSPVRIVVDKNGRIREIRLRDRGEPCNFYEFRSDKKVKYIFVGRYIDSHRIAGFEGDVYPPFPLKKFTNGALYFDLLGRNAVNFDDRREFGITEEGGVIPRIEQSSVVGFSPVDKEAFVPYVFIRDLGGRILSTNRRKISLEYLDGVRVLENVPSFMVIQRKGGKKYHYETIMVKRRPDGKSKTYIIGRIESPDEFVSGKYSVAVDYVRGEILMVKEGRLEESDYQGFIARVLEEVEVLSNDYESAIQSLRQRFPRLARALMGLWERERMETADRAQLVEILPRLQEIIENNRDVIVKDGELRRLIAEKTESFRWIANIIYLFERKGNLGKYRALENILSQILGEIVDPEVLTEAYLWMLSFNDSRRHAMSSLRRFPRMLETIRELLGQVDR